ncbi:MAG TPA: adenylate/guanylate cyclase domain-containing protein [Stellaceae bacterium]|nr:adenylate/guanylate cyclase domain-containing protein [Stellaceae bacterium]
MRFTIAFKVFSIAIGLLALMVIAALVGLRMTRTVDDLLGELIHDYFPAYSTLAHANTRNVQESAYIRRLMLALAEHPRDEAKIADLRRRVADAAADSDFGIAETRRLLNRQILKSLSPSDNIEIARLDTEIAFLQEQRKKYELVFAKLLDAARNDDAEADSLLQELDNVRDEFDQHIAEAQLDMRGIAERSVGGTQAHQRRAVEISFLLVVAAGLLGVTVAAAVTMGLVRPVRRLVAGTAAVEGGALDTVIPVTSRDEIGDLTISFNNMVGELRLKARVRDVFGKYVDPRIVSGLLDNPEATDPRASRRQMTILFCDMQSFTSFSEGMTPAGLVTVLNRYLSVISEPVRRNQGIIDKYIGDAVMAFWGEPFTGAEEHAQLACLAAIEQVAAVPGFQKELPDLTGLRRGLPPINVRVGIATGEVVVGSIGSEMTRSYTVIGDTVNFASRIEGAGKAYGTRILISEATQRLAAAAVETREIDSVLVIGKSEPERIFELLGRKGEVGADRLELRDVFAAALVAYREQRWDTAETGFRQCLSIIPEDPPSRIFLDRIAHFREDPPGANWNGVWALTSK